MLSILNIKYNFYYYIIELPVSETGQLGLLKLSEVVQRCPEGVRSTPEMIIQLLRNDLRVHTVKSYLSPIPITTFDFFRYLQS